MGGGCRAETCCSDVTSAAGRQDGRGKLACATKPRGGGGRRRLNVWEGKKMIFYQSAPLFVRDVQAAESLKHESRFGAEVEGDRNGAQIETELCV